MSRRAVCSRWRSRSLDSVPYARAGAGVSAGGRVAHTHGHMTVRTVRRDPNRHGPIAHCLSSSVTRSCRSGAALRVQPA